MKSASIIISHYEALVFLKTAIRQIRRYKHPDINQQIIICDQSGPETHRLVMDLYYGNEDVIVVWTKSLYSGYGLDWILRNIPIHSDYIVQLHTDSFPIHKNWISMPIALIEESNFSFVGQLQFVADGKASIYPPNKFFAMAQCYNVAKTSTYKEMSLEAGFCRYHNRKDLDMEYKNNDWEVWAKEDYNARGSDDDVVAFHWEDVYRNHDKLGLAITGYIEPSYGRIIESVVFHFGSHKEAMSVLDHMPKMYSHYLNKINEDYSDELIDEMVNLAKANRPPELEILSRNLWNGTTKESYPTNSILNQRIEELKK